MTTSLARHATDRTSSPGETVHELEVDAATLRTKLDAIGRAQAMIEFDLAGTIRSANATFLETMGYRLEEIEGKHHSMFVDAAERASSAYERFWRDLASGNFQAGEFKRLAKGAREVWIQASYNPVLDRDRKPCGVIKLATDITSTKRASADTSGQIAAIEKSQAVIEFDLDGTIRRANANFLGVMGYRSDEVVGKHHSMFVEPRERSSTEYARFWSELKAGRYQAGEFKRIAKAGTEVWIQASYNPILDLNGKPFKVVKFAVDVTATKLRNADFQGQIQAIDKAQAVIEFELDGTIRAANDKFLQAMGYRRDEVVGKHHSMFVEADHRASPEYRTFWRDLAAGNHHAGEFKRIGKGGKEVWIQASYNPILDLNGKPAKVVKYATDLTASRMLQTIRRVVEKVAANATSLGAASEEMSAVSGNLSASASQTSSQATSASAASEQVTKSISAVAAAIEEMTASVREIAKNTHESSGITKSALKAAESTNRNVRELGDSTSRIGDIIKVISAIAQQTNLLALNATIEAARAGAAGKGFAVVAGEVKELAKATAKATEEIGQKLDVIRNGTGSAVDEIAKIVEIVGQIDRISDVIAAAVEEQTATTAEISKNIAEVTTGSGAIARNVHEVALAAQNTEQGAGAAQSSAVELSRMAGELRQLVESARF